MNDIRQSLPCLSWRDLCSSAVLTKIFRQEDDIRIPKRFPSCKGNATLSRFRDLFLITWLRDNPLNMWGQTLVTGDDKTIQFPLLPNAPPTTSSSEQFGTNFFHSGGQNHVVPLALTATHTDAFLWTIRDKLFSQGKAKPYSFPWFPLLHLRRILMYSSERFGTNFFHRGGQNHIGSLADYK